MPINAKIIGCGGYGGVGMTELLLGHPQARIGCLVDVQDIGKRISDLYPHLNGFCDEKIVSPDNPQAQEKYDVVFYATPDGVGQALASEELKKGARIIDYSGDFRFNTLEAYSDYATRLGRNPEHAAAELLADAVYGLPEMYHEQLNSERRLVGNPGCFAISCILGLAPAAKHGLVDLTSIICDCKTGVSGAGKKAHPVFHYPARYDQMNAYKLAGHQHVCEVERELGLLAGENICITFTAQVVPTCRGIMSCLYGTLDSELDLKDVRAAYDDFYKDAPFIRLYDRNGGIGTVHVRGTNYCNLIVDMDDRTRRLRVISHIDNLIKGQAGNALQNMNLLFGLPETMGLQQPGQYP
jgi:N-acetyl-gamma-glutamyl-phosphate reductase